MSLLGELQNAPYRFEFFEVMRRLECVYHERARLGRSARPAEDPIRLGQEPDLAFAAASLASFVHTEATPPRLAVRFFGLFGPNGPLPRHLTEYARARAANHGDRTFARFADVFHHRMLSLFYRAWADAQPVVAFDRPSSDRFAVYVGSFFGMATRATRERHDVPDLAKLHYAGHLACPTRHAGGLASILEDFFGMHVEIREFVGTWMELPTSWQCRLGTSPETGTLGRTLTVGARVWECQNKFRVALGPLTLDDYISFLPGSVRLSRLAALVQSYANGQWDFDVQLILRCDQVPATVLDGSCRLGWTTWLDARHRTEDPGDLVVVPRSSGAAGAELREAETWQRSAE